MHSLSELDTTSKRASRAAGYSWGISEEIGKAIRGLELFGLPGIVNLNLYLKKIKKNHPNKLDKINKENKSKELCPIYCGVAFLDQCNKLEKFRLRVEGGKLSEKMFAKVTSQSEKQQKIVEKMISTLGLSNDVMDETIEKIYEIAAGYREAGKLEREIEKQLRISLTGVKKLAKNWIKQKSV